MKITCDKEHKKLGSKPWQNPTRGKTQENPLLIETDQSEISMTQDQVSPPWEQVDLGF